MLSNNLIIAAVAALGSFDGASAQGEKVSRSSADLVARVPQHSLNDGCHPNGNGVYTIPSTESYAPCMVQQLIDIACERFIKNRAWNEYWSCLREGSYQDEWKQCIDCKHKHNMLTQVQFTRWTENVDKVFKLINEPNFSFAGTFWKYFDAHAHWANMDHTEIPVKQWISYGTKDSNEWYAKYNSTVREHKAGPAKSIPLSASRNEKRELEENDFVVTEKDGVKFLITLVQMLACCDAVNGNEYKV
ncbi:hypothetical protein GQ602_006360 [Ophiocordyceps camponoti-floridani]|uniref:Uncharacterized protein n=1 Tax=Ophiocordyceps camponoti-floridani TaxID=2030778 RepID=A0A8H4Q302_9HYPO|nr:hypothetical protein GQ602_006360 [Ophiocordyceps camponoti-floridani]